MVIKESEVTLNVKKRCYVLGVNRSSYYKWLKAKPRGNDEYIQEQINKIYQEHKGTYGYLRITQTMRNAGILVNHKKVYRIMRKLGLKAVIRKKWCKRSYRKENTTYNILNRDFKTSEPLKKLVCDVTELRPVKDKRYYLFSIMDLYNNAIIALNVSFHNDWGLVEKGLEKLTGNMQGILLHSDQGVQFTSIQYREITRQKNITLSMSRLANCYDNAAKESFFSHFKEEFYIYYNPKTQDELYQNIAAFIYYYNNERIQMRFKMSPVQYLNSQNSLLAANKKDLPY